MVTNGIGHVALKTYNATRRLETVGDGTQYVFVIRANISLTWVAPEHVDQILNKRKGCCGGKKKPIYTHASETDVRRWTNGGGR